MRLTKVFPTDDGGVLTTGFQLGITSQSVYAFMTTSTGSPNTDFGGNGDTAQEFAISTVSIDSRCAALQSDGSILIAGHLTSQDFVGDNLFMVRLFPIDSSSSISSQDLKGLSIYPNPSNGTINIEFEQKINTIELISAQGQLVNSWSNPPKSLSVEVIPGTYAVRVITGDSIMTRQLIISE